MEIKWYWPMEMLGFVENISAEYQDGYIHYSVSGSCDTVMMWLLLGLFPLLFLFGFLTRRLSARAGRDTLGIWLARVSVALLLGYALLLSIGVGPYIQFYPSGGGFISFDTLEHLLYGIYCALLALSLLLGGKLGKPK